MPRNRVAVAPRSLPSGPPPGGLLHSTRFHGNTAVLPAPFSDLKEPDFHSTLSSPPRSPIEPFPPGTDYFSALGLPRKLVIDLRDLERRYYELSRRFHPDFFQSAPTRERLASLENSALINKAYHTLRDPLARAEYLVRLEA